MFTRRTSVYQIDVPGASLEDLKGMVSRCSAELAGSGLSQLGAFVRVRVPDDFHVAKVAEELAPDWGYTIRTGYGVNERPVEMRLWGKPCWDCKSARTIVRPDEAMQFATDEIVCLDCGELQDPEQP